MPAASRTREPTSPRDPFVLPLEHRVQRNGGADAREGYDHLKDAAEEDGSIRAGPRM